MLGSDIQANRIEISVIVIFRVLLLFKRGLGPRISVYFLDIKYLLYLIRGVEIQSVHSLQLLNWWMYISLATAILDGTRTGLPTEHWAQLNTLGVWECVFGLLHLMG